MLSDEKIEELRSTLHIAISASDFRAIEAAVLAEQAKAGPIIWVDGGHLREVSNGNEMNIYATPEATGRLVPLYLHPAPAPEGMVMVPREPTEAMLHAGLKACLDLGFSVATTVRLEIYRAMIAAAEKEQSNAS